MNIQESLKHHNHKKLEYWQIAADGVWEECLKLAVSPNDRDIEATLDWVDTQSDNIAIEAFFGDEEDLFFIGVRITKLSKPEKQEFLKNLLNSSNEKSNWIDVFQNISDLLSKPSPLENNLNFLQLGAEGIWLSYGPYTVWEKTDDTAKDYDDIKQNAGHLLKEIHRPIMLELAWMDPYECWAGNIISNKTENGFQFSRENYESLTSDLFSD